jgi:tetratricopeptide (TPR) repeat protein
MDFSNLGANVFGFTDDDTFAKDDRVGETGQESFTYAQQNMAIGRYAAGIAHLERAVGEQQFDDPAALMALGSAYQIMGETEKARLVFERLLKQSAERADTHVALADIERAEANHDQTLAHLQRAIAEDPSNPYYQLRLAEYLRDRGYRKAALVAARLSVAAAPEDSFYQYWLADLMSEMGLFEESLVPFQAAIELSPGDDYLYTQLAISFWKVGRENDAVRAMEFAIHLNPDNVTHRKKREIMERALGREVVQSVSDEDEGLDTLEIEKFRKRLGL